MKKNKTSVLVPNKRNFISKVYNLKKMSGFGNLIERKFYQVKSHVGGGERTVDSDVQYSKNKLTESHKKFKNILTVTQKLASTIHATNLMQVEVLTTLSD
ncbi:SH3 domain containing protein, partial [Entamoeba invadens IP1]